MLRLSVAKGSAHILGASPPLSFREFLLRWEPGFANEGSSHAAVSPGRGSPGCPSGMRKERNLYRPKFLSSGEAVKNKSIRAARTTMLPQLPSLEYSCRSALRRCTRHGDRRVFAPETHWLAHLSKLLAVDPAVPGHRRSSIPTACRT